MNSNLQFKNIFTNGNALSNDNAITGSYLPFVDGLRAYALIGVLLFHFELLGFSGGFLGVDLFFLISGFLVGGQILKAVEVGEFSYQDFFVRRIRRILPALYVVSFAVIGVACILFLPTDLLETAKSGSSSALIYANIHFFYNLDYFTETQSPWVFLHYWSLSVEEQFYIALPLIALLGRRLGLSVKAIAFIVLLSSMLIWIYFLDQNPAAAFYLAPARAWEFMVGAQLALLPKGIRWPHWVATLTSLAGFAICGFCMIFAVNDLSFSGFAVPLMILGSALVFCSNLYGAEPRIAVPLTLPPLLSLGKISYSVYLVHWPILKFVEYWSVEPLSTLSRAALLIPTLLLGWLSWRYVELPFRARSKVRFLSDRRALFIIAVSSVIFLSLTNWITSQRGFKDQLPQAVEARLDDRKHFSMLRQRCHSDEVNKPIAATAGCVIGADVAPDTAVWSDSLGVELADALGRRRKFMGRSVLMLTSSSCPPLSGDIPDMNRQCMQRNIDVANYLATQKGIKTVVLTMLYGGYLNLERDVELAALQASVEKLRAADKIVYVLAPIPRPRFDVPTGTARAVFFNRSTVPKGVDRIEYDGQYAAIIADLALITKRHGAKLIRVDQILCEPKLCPYYIDGKAMYFDDRHPSLEAAERIAEQIDPNS